MFRGEIPDSEIWDDCRGDFWAPWIRLFLPLINNRHGFYQHYLFSGALMDQPAAVMRIMGMIQNEYYGYLREANTIH